MSHKIHTEQATQAEGRRTHEGARAPGTSLLVLGCLFASMVPLVSLHAAGISDLTAPRVATLLQTYHAQGCAGGRGSPRALRSLHTLSAAAARWSRGAPLEVAIEGAGYRAERSVALEYRGTSDGLRSAVLLRLCRPLTQSAFRDFGVWVQGDAVWILLASPFQAPASSHAPAVSAELLRLINHARSQARRCGARAFGAAAPLQLDARLSRAAEHHAQDMLAHDFFDHRGSDASTPATRVAATGYRYRLVGENIAEGPETATEAVQGWLASPGHCENIMDPAFRDTGTAFAVNQRGVPRIYWVQDLAARAPAEH
jgi:uncharacterized protein YkwD